MKKDEFAYVWTDKKRTLFGLPISFTRYFLTETKFITRTGFLSVDEDEIDLYKITDKKVRFPFFQRLFKCGSIIIYSRDADTPSKEIHCIMRDKYGIRGRDMINFHDHYDDVDTSNDFDII